MFGVYFSTSALIITCILTYVFFSKRRVNNVETKAYSRLLILTIIGLFFEIISCIWFNYGANLESISYKMMSKMTASYFLIWSSLFVEYMLGVCGDKKILQKNLELYI